MILGQAQTFYPSYLRNEMCTYEQDEYNVQMSRSYFRFSDFAPVSQWSRGHKGACLRWARLLRHMLVCSLKMFPTKRLQKQIHAAFQS